MRGKGDNNAFYWKGIFYSTTDKPWNEVKPKVESSNSLRPTTPTFAGFSEKKTMIDADLQLEISPLANEALVDGECVEDEEP
jgi:hypothetical protein